MSEQREWQVFYQELGIDCDLSGVVIPNDPGGFGRVIIIASGITPKRAFDLCARTFFVQNCIGDLGRDISSRRCAKDSPYAIRFRNRVEAEKEEYENFSGNALVFQERWGEVFEITLEERLIFEVKFFRETGQHLDTQNVTLCSGSRYLGIGIPLVSWRAGRLLVDWAHPDGDTDTRRHPRRVIVP